MVSNPWDTPVLTFKVINNKAEYEALITSLRLAKGIGITFYHVYFNLQLVVNQVKGEYVAKWENMKIYFKEAKALGEGFEDLQIYVIPQESNQEVDALSK